MEGFQDAYLAINLAVISWLENTAGNKPLLRIAGHSLGAALATLCAVDVKQRGWQIDGVVTFELATEDSNPCIRNWNCTIVLFASPMTVIL